MNADRDKSEQPKRRRLDARWAVSDRALREATERAEAAERERDDLRGEVENQRQSARTAWDVHAEHVETMNVRLLHEQAVADDLRAVVARVERLMAHLHTDLVYVGDLRAALNDSESA